VCALVARFKSGKASRPTGTPPAPAQRITRWWWWGVAGAAVRCGHVALGRAAIACWCAEWGSCCIARRARVPCWWPRWGLGECSSDVLRPCGCGRRGRVGRGGADGHRARVCGGGIAQWIAVRFGRLCSHRGAVLARQRHVGGGGKHDMPISWLRWAAFSTPLEDTVGTLCPRSSALTRQRIRGR
jgi:hypothetical protein